MGEERQLLFNSSRRKLAFFLNILIRLDLETKENGRPSEEK